MLIVVVAAVVSFRLCWTVCGNVATLPMIDTRVEGEWREFAIRQALWSLALSIGA